MRIEILEIINGRTLRVRNHTSKKEFFSKSVNLPLK